MEGSRKLGNKLKVPVPSDIDIAQSIEPLPISHIAKSVGIKDDVRSLPNQSNNQCCNGSQLM